MGPMGKEGGLREVEVVFSGKPHGGKGGEWWNVTSRCSLFPHVESKYSAVKGEKPARGSFLLNLNTAGMALSERGAASATLTVYRQMQECLK